MLDGKWRKLIERKEKIIVKGQGDIEHIVRSTHRGPLLNYIISSIGMYNL